ncbi:MAG: PilZ domain-containing protein [Cystobacterineae bacterium]|nr:PilZ domain-containing protein [Cystobacterineae bacterium]
MTTRVEVRFENAKEAARIFKTYSLNLSPSGICIRNTQRLLPGEHIRLSLVVDGQKFELGGHITWAKEGVVGIRFEGMSSQERLRLESAIWPTQGRQASERQKALREEQKSPREEYGPNSTPAFA